jgi:TusA-related sulfurtransferase
MSDAVGRALDLRGTRCPLNYVKTRLALERVEIGGELEVWLDLGEPADQVPRSLQMDGQEVEALPQGEGFFRLRVRRRR